MQLREQFPDRISGYRIAQKGEQPGEKCANYYEKCVLPLNCTFHVKFRTFP